MIDNCQDISSILIILNKFLMDKSIHIYHYSFCDFNNIINKIMKIYIFCMMINKEDICYLNQNILKDMNLHISY